MMDKKTVPEQLGHIAKGFAGMIEQMDQMKEKQMKDNHKNFSLHDNKKDKKGGEN